MIVGLIGIALLGYYLFVVNDTSVITVDNEQVSLQAEAETQSFLRRLNELKTIELSGELFSDNRFTSLVDSATPVRPESVGRVDPLAPAN